MPDTTTAIEDYSPKYECTWYAAHEWEKRYASTALFFPKNGRARNANRWPGLADAAGLPRSDVPVIGAVAVFNIGPFGHVAIVESVNDDGTVNVSEYNYAGPHTFGTRQHVGGAVTYILPPAGASTEFSEAWEKMMDWKVFSSATQNGHAVTTDELAVFLLRFKKTFL